ncbi:MAG: hypothetical protein DRH32_07290 [Deltaproteobacteria bacterium]|nr:MAG: hypothetical protein DRH32_07290 [Deltaproteobacteria bacterium]
MKINDILFELFRERAESVLVDHLCVGLGYTAVATSDGGIGIAYTWLDKKKSCCVWARYENPEGAPAIGMLEQIRGTNPLGRTVALAVINALNHRAARDIPEDDGNEALADRLCIGKGTRVAMVGAFAPLLGPLRKRGAAIEVVDSGKGVGDRDRFRDRRGGWADVLIMTSTTLINNTTEEILGYVGPNVRTVLLGPSTPLVKEPFSHLPVHLLAGTVLLDRDAVLRSVRHGAGTPVIQKFGRKVVLEMEKRQAGI